jgi:hypothetical protein
MNSFRKAISKSDRKKFDEMMFDIPRLYISQLALMQFIIQGSLFNTHVNLLYCYGQLADCISQVDQRRAKVERLQMVEDSTQSKLFDF